MSPRQLYLRKMDEKMADWKIKIGTVQLKARLQGKESTWLEHALSKQDEMTALLEEIRGGDREDLEKRKAQIAILAEELEVTMVRAAERFQETRELGFDPEARREHPRRGKEAPTTDDTHAA